MKVFVWIIIVVVASTIVAGFFIVGSPQTERLRRFDERRISDLQNIQWQLVNFWQSRERLPDSLDELRDDISGYVSPKDPQTGLPYEYTKGEGLSFLLCAEFSSAEGQRYDSPRITGPLGNEIWEHGEGRHCFERTIDPELYPQFEKPIRIQ